ncbi:hypothetical protein K431DRAFT_154689 [Polychaeton citri CBS 116435]|uniref:Band 7 domain-containing protein n=1 Tax=Polychaeton citri CBS 116435 TaxID=1314669 RepID=A0A9P4QBP6_9PEZI|nr:hypothetical protein K431DRAFT_154689 [Polychaeton citri CBS 116435]
MWYQVSEPNSYLAVTGAGIDNVKIVKKCFVLPFQKVAKISITPFDFEMTLEAMTSEKLQFSLPAVFTIGPDDTVQSLQKYATLLTGNADGQISEGRLAVIKTGRGHVQNIVKGIIEGETRALVANMTMDELFNKRSVFRNQVIENVQKEVDAFGLRIYNANVKELKDMGDSKYFESLSRKAREGAVSQAQVDVAGARMHGRVGEAEREGEAKQRIAQINAKTALAETDRKVEKANADQKLKKREIEIERDLNLEQIAAQRAGEERDAELQKGVEQKRADMELERQRAETVTKAKIARESAEQKADADLYSQKQKADGLKYNQQMEAEAIQFRAQKDADASLYKKTRDAEAVLFAKEKEAQAMLLQRQREAEARERDAEANFTVRKREAEGLTEMAKAYGALASVLGGPQGLIQYLMLQDGTYEKLATANAKAINGLQPKINVWNTGSQGSEGVMDPTAPIRNLFQCLPPMLSTIQDQTGMQPPSWLASMPQQQQQQPPQNGQMTAEEKAARKQKLLSESRT